jgi:putative transposase
MTYNPNLHHRPSIRLAEYDYSQAYDRACIFGKIVDGKMVDSEFGKIVTLHWQNLSKHH